MPATSSARALWLRITECRRSTRQQRANSTYDYDMVPYRWDQSLSPGNEQSFYWGSASADVDGTRNYMSTKGQEIDAMIAAKLLIARERKE